MNNSMTEIKRYNNNTSVCFWSWNYLITEEGIRNQLSEFADGRIGGVVIHSRAGLEIPYMGKRWMELFKYAVEVSGKLGLEVWIYDEDGWPSGFGAGKIPSQGDAYRLKKLSYGTPEEYAVSANSALPVAVYLPDDCGGYVRAEEYDVSRLPGNALVLWKTVEQNYVDLLEPAVTDLFIKTVHERYKEAMSEYFGSVIKGFFTDEPQMNVFGYVWSDALCDRYSEIYGRALTDDLWMIASDSREAERFKYRYWNLVSELYYENFVKKLSQWCEENGLALTGHFPYEDGLMNQLPSCGNLMKNYTAMQLPAIDHLGSRTASPVLMKQVSSISRQYGNGSVLSETFGCSGWGVSFRRLEWIWGGQSVLGITKPCYHLSAYSMEGRRKRDYPAFFSYQEPWWKDFSSFAAWMDRFNRRMTAGKRVLNTLVLIPLTEMKCVYNDEEHGCPSGEYISASFRVLVENLIDLQLDFDLTEAELLCRDALIGEKHFRIGNVEYDTFIVPSCRIITPQTYGLICRLSAQGVRIIFSERLPQELTDGTVCSFEGVKYILLQNRRNTMEKYFEFYGLERRVKVVRKNDLKPVSGLRLHTRVTEKGLRVHIWPGEDFGTQHVYVSLNENVIPYSFEPEDGSRERLPLLKRENGCLIPITVRAFENLLLELDFGEADSFLIPELSSVKDISEVLVIPEEANAFTVDKASVSFDGGVTFSEKMQIVRLVDFIYSGINGKAENIILRYEFTCDPDLELSDITLAYEDRSVKALIINGKPFSGKREGSWIDLCIGNYRIGEYLRPGLNSVDIHYNISSAAKDDQNLFETEKNRFYHSVEPDCVYVRGDFDVKTEKESFDNGFCLQTSGDFILVTPEKKGFGDLTRQGMWFYRGNVFYRFEIPACKDIKTKIVLVIDSYSGTAAAVTINNRRKVSHHCPARFDITEECGVKTEVTVELLGSNRNLLGPHHYVKGESFIVCPATYAGRWEILPEILSPELYKKNTGTEKYGFIPFGIKRIYIESYEEFSMLFYRKDILAELGIETSELSTWESILENVLPELSVNSLTFGVPVSINSYLAFLFQNGGEVYLNGGRRSAFADTTAVKSMEKYTKLFTQYGLPLAFDFANRFRSGEMPVAIADYLQYNQLTVFAPEIKGLWSMLPIPGTADETGNINQTETATFTASIILGQCEDKASAFEFLKWWTSEDVQSEYGSNLESVVGSAARYNSANLNAINSTQWSGDIRKALNSQIERLTVMPQVPGGYITTRYYDFAFRDIVYSSKNIKESMEDAAESINAELSHKRTEYGLDKEGD